MVVFLNSQNEILGSVLRIGTPTALPVKYALNLTTHPVRFGHLVTLGLGGGDGVRCWAGLAVPCTLLQCAVWLLLCPVGLCAPAVPRNSKRGLCLRPQMPGQPTEKGVVKVSLQFMPQRASVTMLAGTARCAVGWWPSVGLHAPVSLE